MLVVACRTFDPSLPKLEVLQELLGSTSLRLVRDPECNFCRFLLRWRRASLLRRLATPARIALMMHGASVTHGAVTTLPLVAVRLERHTPTFLHDGSGASTRGGCDKVTHAASDPLPMVEPFCDDSWQYYMKLVAPPESLLRPCAEVFRPSEALQKQFNSCRS